MKRPGNSSLYFPFCENHQIESTLKKVKVQARKEKLKIKKEYKEQNKSIAQLIQEARKPFQQWIRIRDANKPCISCGSVDSMIWDAGHFKKAELYPGMIFNEMNVD
jgi:2-C-methyl-D-erythritol 4-phosphate cytidylyltransferase